MERRKDRRRGHGEAIRRSGARVLVLRTKNATAAQMAGVLVKARHRVEGFVARTDAPFVAGIDRSGGIRNYPI